MALRFVLTADTRSIAIDGKDVAGRGLRMAGAREATRALALRERKCVVA